MPAECIIRTRCKRQLEGLGNVQNVDFFVFTCHTASSSEQLPAADGLKLTTQNWWSFRSWCVCEFRLQGLLEAQELMALTTQNGWISTCWCVSFGCKGFPQLGSLQCLTTKNSKFRNKCVCEFGLQGLPTAGELTTLKRTTKNKLEVSGVGRSERTGVKGSESVGVPDNKCEFSVLSPVLCSFGYRNHTVLKMQVRLQWGKREEWVSNVCAGVRQLSQSGVMTTMFFGLSFFICFGVLLLDNNSCRFSLYILKK